MAFTHNINTMSDHIINQILNFLVYDPLNFSRTYQPKILFINNKFMSLYNKCNYMNTKNLTHIRVKFLVEISDHDGYCSGEDNEYSSYCKSINICIDPYINHTYLMQLVNNTLLNAYNCCKTIGTWDDLNFHNDFSTLVPNMYNEQSGYCGPSQESVNHNMNNHSFRISFKYFILIYKKIII
jgi:hypothetical protein